MRLALITDVHSDIANLRCVLEALYQQGFDRLITLGDTCDAFAPPQGSDDVAHLLLQENATGVWGNHDFVFQHDTPEFARKTFGAPTFEFMNRTMPQIEINDCHFSHLESSVDPHSPEELWKIEDSELDLMKYAASAFRSVGHRFQFIGHYHQWFAARPEGPIDWDGTSVLDMSRGRYFVVVSAVVSGCCAIFDTESLLLTPISTA